MPVRLVTIDPFAREHALLEKAGEDVLKVYRVTRAGDLPDGDWQGDEILWTKRAPKPRPMVSRVMNGVLSSSRFGW